VTKISFGLSATIPLQTPGRRWDANWTPLSENIMWFDSSMPLPWAPSSGGINASTHAGYIDVPAYDTPGMDRQTVLSIDFGSNHAVAAPVSVNSFMAGSASSPTGTELDISLDAPWNSIKDIEVSSISAQHLDITGFVDTWINTPSDNTDHTIVISDVKRGAIALGNGDDTVSVNVAANEYSWASHFDITAGDGNNTISVQPEAYGVLANIRAPAGWMFNYQPQLTTADISVGNGNDTIGLHEVSGTIHVGSGDDTINIEDGNSIIWLGAGNCKVTIGTPDGAAPAPWGLDSQRGTAIIHPGTGHADITVDDRSATLTPRAKIEFIPGQTGGDTFATADIIRYGHDDPVSGLFIVGKMPVSAFDISAYNQGFTASLDQLSTGDGFLFQIHDNATGSDDAMVLYCTILF
jgi:hypothetical protein